jgi:hypothetical protein
MRLKVECYSGYRGEETPRSIRFETRNVEVREILDQWIGPDHRYFKVRGDDDAVYIIRHDSVTWDWDLIYYKQAEI